MLELRIRACHVYGSFTASDNRRPPLTVTDALDQPRRKTDRIVLPPASYAHEQEKISQRWPAAVDFIRSRGLNEIFGPSSGPVGIVMQGGMYNGVIRALQRLGLADIYGDTRIPLYVLNVTYPLIETEFLTFCEDKQAVLVVEEGQPAYIEDALAAMLYKANGTVHLSGKEMLPVAGEYTGQHVLDGVSAFLRAHAPDTVATHDNGSNLLPTAPGASGLEDTVPVRPPSFCTGCPERPIFAAMKLAQKDIGPLQVSGDIGCHLFGSLSPFEIGGTTMGYGLGPASNAAFDGGGSRRPVSIIGDGGFWHNGLSSSVGNAVFNKSDGVIVVVDNYYAAATGGQDLLSSRAENRSKSTRHPISAALKGIGVDWVREIDYTYDVGRVRDTLKEALSVDHEGPKVIVASSECMLNRQRREEPLASKAVAAGQRLIKPRFGVDEDVCTGDHACIRLSGCPSLSLKILDDPLRDDPVAHIDQSCVGCGNCGEVAEAAVLCPSFYRVDVVHNPGWLERLRHRLADRFIRMLQRRRSRRVLGFGPA
jgi:indolepyruvate ferredoxin oxidoreductase alpha subunit